MMIDIGPFGARLIITSVKFQLLNSDALLVVTGIQAGYSATVIHRLLWKWWSGVEPFYLERSTETLAMWVNYF